MRNGTSYEPQPLRSGELAFAANVSGSFQSAATGQRFIGPMQAQRPRKLPMNHDDMEISSDSLRAAVCAVRHKRGACGKFAAH
jgi:hypothetical protein